MPLQVGVVAAMVGFIMYSQTKIGAYRMQQSPKVISVTASGADEEAPLVKVRRPRAGAPHTLGGQAAQPAELLATCARITHKPSGTI